MSKNFPIEKTCREKWQRFPSSHKLHFIAEIRKYQKIYFFGATMNIGFPLRSLATLQPLSKRITTFLLLFEISQSMTFIATTKNVYVFHENLATLTSLKIIFQ